MKKEAVIVLVAVVLVLTCVVAYAAKKGDSATGPKGFTFRIERKSAYDVQDINGNVQGTREAKKGYEFATINIDVNLNEADVKLDVSNLQNGST